MPTSALVCALFAFAVPAVHSVAPSPPSPSAKVAWAALEKHHYAKALSNFQLALRSPLAAPADRCGLLLGASDCLSHLLREPERQGVLEDAIKACAGDSGVHASFLARRHYAESLGRQGDAPGAIAAQEALLHDEDARCVLTTTRTAPTATTTATAASERSRLTCIDRHSLSTRLDLAYRLRAIRNFQQAWRHLAALESLQEELTMLQSAEGDGERDLPLPPGLTAKESFALAVLPGLLLVEANAVTAGRKGNATTRAQGLLRAPNPNPTSNPSPIPNPNRRHSTAPGGLGGTQGVRRTDSRLIFVLIDCQPRTRS